MCEWTLPSEKSPRKCSVEWLSLTFAISFRQVSDANILPDSMELETSFAPCANTCPAPSAL